MKEILDQNGGAIRPSRIRLGVWAGDGNNVHFLTPVLEALPKHIQVKVFTWDRAIPDDLLQRQLGNVDVAWIEWGSDAAVALSRLTRDTPTICRVHRYEVFSPYPRQITWDNVDCLVMISDYVRDCFARLHGGLPSCRLEIVPNAIPLRAYPFNVDRKRNFNIGFLGRLHYVKNPMLLIHILKKVLERDDRYELHVAGAEQQREISEYLHYQAQQLGISEHLHLYGHLQHSKVRSFLEQCSTIVSTSVIEGHPVGVMEAMASGCKPVIHDFPGARALFEPQHLFNTIDEAAEKILDEAYEPQAYRGYIAQNYEQAQQVDRIAGLIEQMAAKKAAPQAVAV